MAFFIFSEASESIFPLTNDTWKTCYGRNSPKCTRPFSDFIGTIFRKQRDIFSLKYNPLKTNHIETCLTGPPENSITVPKYIKGLCLFADTIPLCVILVFYDFM